MVVNGHTTVILPWRKAKPLRRCFLKFQIRKHGLRKSLRENSGRFIYTSPITKKMPDK